MNLHPHQQQALDDFDAAIAAGARMALIAAATGFGKTHMAGHRMAEMAAAGGRAWFLAHLGELLEDTAGRLDRAGLRYGWIWGDRQRDPGASCQLVSVATAVRRLEDLGPPPDLVIIDECHRAISPSYQQVLDALGRPLGMGLSGTPLRLDGRPMRTAGFDALIRTPDTIDLIDRGFLSPLRAWSFPEPAELARVMRRGNDFDGIAAGEIMAGAAIMGDVLEHWEERCRVGGSTRLTVVFTNSVAEAHATAERWRQAGFRAMAVDGSSPPDVRRRAVERARGGDLDALISADLYVAGLDLPDVGAVVTTRKTDSLVIWLQMVGRGLRRSSVWPDCYLLDHAGNCRRPGLGDPLARRAHLWSLEGDCDRRQREAVPPVAVCERCFSTAMVGLRCLDCGHERQPPSLREVVLLPGQLVEFQMGREERRWQREERKRLAREQARTRAREEAACQSLEDWVALGRRRNYDNPTGWARVRYGHRKRKQGGEHARKKA